MALEWCVGSCGPGESGAGGPSIQVDSGSSDPGEIYVICKFDFCIVLTWLVVIYTCTLLFICC